MAKKAFVYDGSQWVDIAQSTADLSPYQRINRTGLNVVVPTSVTNGTLTANGQITFTSQSSVNVFGCFTSAYKNYTALIDYVHSNGSCVTYIQYYNGATLLNTSGDYRWQETYATTSVVANRSTSDALAQITSNLGVSNAALELKFFNPQASGLVTNTSHTLTAGSLSLFGSTAYMPTTSVNGFRFVFSAGTATGSIRIYGYNDGA